MLEPDFLKHLNKLHLIVQKMVASNYVGERQSVYLGRGSLFRDHRMYAAGDDIRDIDWKVYARTDKLHVRQYDEDRSLTVHIVLDFSASMNFGGTTKKYEYASMMGLGYAYLAWKNNERFVLSTFSDRLERFKPKQGRKQMVQILDYLRDKKPQGKSRFRESLLSYAKGIESRSLIVVISDFLYDLEEIEEVLSRFKDSEIVLIQVLDEMETELKLQGEFQLKDMETDGLIKTFISDKVRKKYLEDLQEHRRKLKWVAESAGATFYSFDTGVPIFDALYEVLRK
jgi:uncharacterized protein (DUF58 family)